MEQPNPVTFVKNAVAFLKSWNFAAMVISENRLEIQIYETSDLAFLQKSPMTVHSITNVEDLSLFRKTLLSANDNKDVVIYSDSSLYSEPILVLSEHPIANSLDNYEF